MDKKKLKQALRKNTAGRLLIACKKRTENAVFYLRRRRYIPTLARLIGNDVSIISSNCFAGRIMQDKGMKYNTPTLGLYFMYPDYIEFLQHLEFYLKDAKIEFVEHSKYPIGDERRSKWVHWYPIGLLGGKVEIHFLHYHTEEEAAEKWYRRALRVNLDRLFVIGMDQNLCTETDMQAFDALPFEQKVFFSSRNVKGSSIVYMQEFAGKGEVGDPYRKGHLFYRYLTEFLQR